MEKMKMIPPKSGGYNKPAEIAKIWQMNGEMTAEMKAGPTFVLAVLGGMFIGFGCLANIMATSPANLSTFAANIMKLIGASLFPVGLMFIIFCGGQLFTGNNLLILAYLKKKISLRALLRNWCIVYLGNFVGSLLLVILILLTGVLTDDVAQRAQAIAYMKVNLPFIEGFVRAVLCNILVILACWFQVGAPDMMGKILAVWFPIALFVFLGFEHCVANMFYIPLGMALGGNISIFQFLISLLIVTCGNILGGAGIIGCTYYYAYLKHE